MAENLIRGFGWGPKTPTKSIPDTLLKQPALFRNAFQGKNLQDTQEKKSFCKVSANAQTKGKVFCTFLHGNYPPFTDHLQLHAYTGHAPLHQIPSNHHLSPHCHFAGLTTGSNQFHLSPPFVYLCSSTYLFTKTRL